MILNNLKYKSEAILILVTLLWGATFVIIKEALHDISPMVFLAIRFFIAGIVLIPFIIKRKFDKQTFSAGVLLGVLLFLGFATQTIGLNFTSATKSSFLTGTVVIIIPLLQILIEKRPPTKGVIIGAFLVIVGISFLSSGGSSIMNLFQDISTNFNFGDGLTLICALFFALYIIYLDLKASRHDFVSILFLQIITTSILATLFLLLFSVAEIESMKFNLTNKLISALIYTSIFATLVTTALQTKYQKNVTPSKAGIIFSFEPIFASVFAFFILEEKITNFGYLGAILIILGLLVSELYETMILNNEKK